MSVAIIWHTCEGAHRTYRHKAALCLTILQSQDATLSICTFEIHLRSGTKYDLNFLGICTVHFFKLRTKDGHEDSYIFTAENGAIAISSFQVTTTCSVNGETVNGEVDSNRIGDATYRLFVCSVCN